MFHCTNPAASESYLMIDLTSSLLSRNLPSEPGVLIFVKLTKDFAHSCGRALPEHGSSKVNVKMEKGSCNFHQLKSFTTTRCSQDKRAGIVWSWCGLSVGSLFSLICIYKTLTYSIIISWTYTGPKLSQFQVEGQNPHNTGIRPHFSWPRFTVKCLFEKSVLFHSYSTA